MVKRTGSAVRLVNSSLLTSLGELCNVFKPQVPHLKKKKRTKKNTSITRIKCDNAYNILSKVPGLFVRAY